MISFRCVAFPLGFVALSGALIFTLSIARGQDGAAPTTPGAPAPAAGTGSPVFKQTIGISPIQTGLKSPNVSYAVLGGTGNETYDLQSENVYSLLRERGANIPNVLHPLSTAKPSFIIERLIVLNKPSAATPANGAQPAPAQGAPAAAGATGAAQSTTTLPPISDASATVSAIRAVVGAEISRGTGRLGGGHLLKLRNLQTALLYMEKSSREERYAAQKSLEAQINNTIAGRKSVQATAAKIRTIAAIGTADALRNAAEAIQLDKEAAEQSAQAGQNANDAAKFAKMRDEDEIRARLAARRADLYVPSAY